VFAQRQRKYEWKENVRPSNVDLLVTTEDSIQKLLKDEEADSIAKEKRFSISSNASQ